MTVTDFEELSLEERLIAHQWYLHERQADILGYCLTEVDRKTDAVLQMNAPQGHKNRLMAEAYREAANLLEEQQEYLVFSRHAMRNDWVFRDLKLVGRLVEQEDGEMEVVEDLWVW